MGITQVRLLQTNNSKWYVAYWTSYVRNDFWSRIRLERLLYDAERDFLAIAKLLVMNNFV